jgi:hypothetical protein
LSATPVRSTSAKYAASGQRQPPSWPPSAVVMPWRTWLAASGLARTPLSAWLWVSMKPGASTRPFASTTRAPAGGA